MMVSSIEGTLLKHQIFTVLSQIYPFLKLIHNLYKNGFDSKKIQIQDAEVIISSFSPGAISRVCLCRYFVLSLGYY